MSETHDHPSASLAPEQAAKENLLVRSMRWWGVRDILVPFLATRVALTLVAWLALSLFGYPPSNPDAWELKPNGQVGHVSGHVSNNAFSLLNIWARWDSGWYLSIARDGYQFAPGEQSSTAFFPLYPLLMQGVHLFVPSQTDASWLFSGFVVANAALLAGLYYLALLIRLDFDEATASRTVLYLLVFPTTLFFSAIYTESTFLATTAAAFYYARKNRWFIAGALAGAATLTRAPGILLGLPLLLEYATQRRFQLRKIRFDVLWLALIPVCFAGHMLYFEWRFDNLLALPNAQSTWGRPAGVIGPWVPFLEFFRQPLVVHGGSHSLVDFLFTMGTLALTIAAVVRLRPSYGLFAVSCFLLVTVWGSFGSMPRYCLAAFPTFIMLGLSGRNLAFDQSYMLIAPTLAGFFMVLFALSQWVA